MLDGQKPQKANADDSEPLIFLSHKLWTRSTNNNRLLSALISHLCHSASTNFSYYRVIPLCTSPHSLSSTRYLQTAMAIYGDVGEFQKGQRHKVGRHREI
ncbi:hypothetical protein V2G26_012032 [Clonostachys chloroleuca]